MMEAQLETVIPAAKSLAEGGALVISLSLSIMLGVAVWILFRRLMANFEALQKIAHDYAQSSENHTKAMTANTAALHSIVEESRAAKRTAEALRDIVVQALTKGVSLVQQTPQTGGG